MSTKRTTRRSTSALDDLGPDECVIYLRISQDRTGEQLGVERQEKDCRELARRMGLHVAKIYTDNDTSATNGRVRPAFEAMLRDRPEVIIAWHQDRLLRLTSDLEKVIALEIPVHMVTSGSLDLSTPTGRGVARTVAAWSQVETEHKAERQRAANVQRAERGHWQFSIRPLGYERVGQGASRRIAIVEPEAEIVREIFRRYVAGDSLYALASDLNERGVPTMTGAPWSMERVRQILRNGRYAGIVTSNGVTYDDAKPDWKPIIDRRTWDDSVEQREGRGQAGSWSRSTKHLMSGMVRCGVCGGRMLARPDRGRQVYACTSNWCTSIPAADVEPFVEKLVLARLADPKIVAALKETPDTKPLQKEIDKLERGRRNVTDMLGDGLMDRRTARRKLEDLTAKLDAKRARLKALRQASPLTDLAAARSIPKRWESLSVLDKRRVIEDLNLRVTIAKTRPGRRPLDADGKPIPDLRRIGVEWIEHDDEALA
ncbi:recombinase family protein [Microbacterium sp. NEAU-LLC]|uniref:Recombinase family protein n=1 Tax=Microbacterium helvum TaxID=2773713 RepID=A0ABR8NPI9_9MICO|nr:recombinase family protein [Microbacterium helvum]MBD3941692.1 recombinase family protein [Microbacterium helvum]